jgi:hypothetical protein
MRDASYNKFNGVSTLYYNNTVFDYDEYDEEALTEVWSILFIAYLIICIIFYYNFFDEYWWDYIYPFFRHYFEAAFKKP